MNTELPTNRTDTIERLKQAGVTPTQQRIEIAQLLFAKHQHVSAEQVLAIVNAEGAIVSKATVYNTLGLFARKGLLREVIVDPTKVFYDSNTSEHHHFYNVDSGELMDIGPQAVKLDDMPELPTGTQPVGVDVIIRVRESNS